MMPVPFDQSIKDPLERVKKQWDDLKATSPNIYGSEFFHIFRPVSAEYTHNGTQATVVYECDELPESVGNNIGNLHGGASATLFDILTSVAIAPLSQPTKFRYGGVSRTLSCGYTRGVPAGVRARVVCEVVNVGARLALIHARLYDEQGRLCVVCDHHKASIDPPKI